MKNNLLLGVIFILLSGLFYATQTSIIKLEAIHLSVPILVFVQNFVCLVLILPVIYLKHKKRFLNLWTFSSVKRLHIIRAIFSVSISYFLFIALKHMPYFDSILLFNAFPLFTPLISFIFLKSKLQHLMWPFLILGFVGVALTMNIDGKIFSLPAIFALCSAISAAISIVLMRKISISDDSIKSLYFYFLIATIVSGIISIPYWNIELNIYVGSLLIIGILFFLVQYFMVLAATYTTPTVVSNLYYGNIIFSLIISIFLFGGAITNRSIIGMLCIMLGGLGVIYIQRRKKTNNSRCLVQTSNNT